MNKCTWSDITKDLRRGLIRQCTTQALRLYVLEVLAGARDGFEARFVPEFDEPGASPHSAFPSQARHSVDTIHIPLGAHGALLVVTGDHPPHAEDMQELTELGEDLAHALDGLQELERTQANLRQSQARVDTIFARASVGLVEADLESGKFLRVSHRWADMLGLPVETLVGMKWSEITHPEDRSGSRELLRQLREEPSQDVVREKRYLRSDGSVVRARVTYARAMEADTGREYAIATIEDVGEVHRSIVALEEHEHQLATIFDVTPAGIVVTRNSDGRVVQINRGTTELFGWVPEEMVGRTLREIGLFLDVEDLRKCWRGFSSGGLLPPTECRMQGKTGHEGIFLVSARSAEIGGVPCSIGILYDVTELRRANRALEESALQTQMMFDIVPVGIVQVEYPSGRLLTVNGRCSAITGYSSEELLGMRIADLTHPDDSEVDRNFFAQVETDARSEYHLRKRYLRKNGEIAHVEVGVSMVRDAEGRPYRSIAVIEDVTARTRDENELRASKERYQSLVDNLEDIVFSLDSSGRFTFVSRSLKRLGFEPKALLGRPVQTLLPPSECAYLKRFAKGLEGDIKQEWNVLDAAGKERVFRVKAALVSGSEGASGIAMDITAQRNTEEQLRAAQKMEAIGKLAGGVAHDFNNLLTVILSYTELVKERLAPGDPAADDLGAVMAAGERAKSLTQQLLAFSRRQLLIMEPLDLNERLASLENMLGRLIGEDIALDVRLGEGLHSVRADQGQLDQVFLNLAINARDAMPHGGRLSLSTENVVLDKLEAAEYEVSSGDYAMITVSDTGMGMDEATQARIFEPFYTTKAVGKGTGLGLSMVHGIVHQSGGGISVRSSPGKGAEFRIFFKRCEERPPLAGTSTPPIPSGGGQETVLIVEDEPALLALASRILSRAGYRVISASHGGEAVGLCEAQGHGIDLVLSDVVMPGMSGPELLDKVRPLCPSARYMLMSGYPNDMLRDRGVAGQPFLKKPFNVATLTTSVRATLDRTS